MWDITSSIALQMTAYQLYSQIICYHPSNGLGGSRVVINIHKSIVEFNSYISSWCLGNRLPHRQQVKQTTVSSIIQLKHYAWVWYHYSIVHEKQSQWWWHSYVTKINRVWITLISIYLVTYVIIIDSASYGLLNNDIILMNSSHGITITYVTNGNIPIAVYVTIPVKTGHICTNYTH